MYIEPNTIIRVLHHVPLDPTYEHTLWWSTEQNRDNYFIGKTKYTFERQYYQRVNKGTMRIKRKAEDLYDCNYLMFKNTNFGNKWFFAFIKSVEYVNNETSEIAFEIDVMQTYFFDYMLTECFVEREHSVTDNIGDNIVPEDVDVGEYADIRVTTPALFNNLSMVVWSTVDRQYNPTAGFFKDTTVSGLNAVDFPLTYNGYSSFVNWYNDMPILDRSGIVAITICPTVFLGSEPVTEYVDVPINTQIYRSDGNLAKNKKLLTYPYNYILGTDHKGNSCDYRYEFFDQTFDMGNNVRGIRFYAKCGVSPNVSVCMLPYKYNGVNAPLSDDLNRNECITISGFPMVAWNQDAFSAWLAQSASSNILSGIFAGHAMAQSGRWSGGVAANYLSKGLSNYVNSAPGPGNIIGTGYVQGKTFTPSASQMSAAIAVAGVAANAYKAIKSAPISRGSQGDFTGIESGTLKISYVNRQVRPEFVDIIDDYFSKYGYACKRVKIPNTHSRPEYNYVKTAGCIIEPYPVNGYGVPADDERLICEIYDAGITFWKNPDHVGYYSSVNNAPIST